MNRLGLLWLLRHCIDRLRHHWVFKSVFSLVLIRDESLLVLRLNMLNELVLRMTPGVDDIHVRLTLHEVRLVTLIFRIRCVTENEGRMHSLYQDVFCVCLDQDLWLNKFSCCNDLGDGMSVLIKFGTDVGQLKVVAYGGSRVAKCHLHIVDHSVLGWLQDNVMSDSVWKIFDLHFVKVCMVFKRHPTVVYRGWLSHRVPHCMCLVIVIVSLSGEQVYFSPDLVTTMD